MCLYLFLCLYMHRFRYFPCLNVAHTHCILLIVLPTCPPVYPTEWISNFFFPSYSILFYISYIYICIVVEDWARFPSDPIIWIPTVSICSEWVYIPDFHAAEFSFGVTNPSDCWPQSNEIENNLFCCNLQIARDLCELCFTLPLTNIWCN